MGMQGIIYSGYSGWTSVQPVACITAPCYFKKPVSNSLMYIILVYKNVNILSVHSRTPTVSVYRRVCPMATWLRIYRPIIIIIVVP